MRPAPPASRTAGGARDEAAAAAARAATEDLLRSRAAADVAELARCERAYVAHQMAQGLSEREAQVWSLPQP